MMRIYGIVGAGGFAREVMPVAEAMLRQSELGRDWELVFVVKDGEPTDEVNGHRVLCESDLFAIQAEKYFNIAMTDCRLRERLASQFLEKNAIPFAIRAPNCISLDENEVGEGAIFCAFTMITSNARIGRFFHANIYSYVAHDCRIGDFVTFAPKVCCNGNVVVEDYAYIGTGAVIKQGTSEKPLVIGRGAVVGMGAVVTKDVAPFTTVVGNPAVPLEKKTK